MRILSLEAPFRFEAQEALGFFCATVLVQDVPTEANGLGKRDAFKSPSAVRS